MRTMMIAILLVLCSGVAAPAQEEAVTEAKALTVQAEDELAPVRQIQNRLALQLSQPLESLDLSLIMEGPAFFGHPPRALRWDGDGSRFWFQWQRWEEDEGNLYEYSLAEGSLTALTKNEAERIPPAWGASWNEDRSQALWVNRHGLIRYTVGADAEVLVSGLSGLRFLDFADGGGYLLLYKNNIFHLQVDSTPSFKKLTDIRSGREENDAPKSTSQQWLAEQQKALFEIINRRAEEKEAEQARRQLGNPQPYYLAGKDLLSALPSTDAEFAGLLLRSADRSKRIAEMPDYVTESGYTESKKVRVKAGDSQDSFAISLMHIPSGQSAAIDFGLEKRQTRVMSMEWSPDAAHLLLQLRAVDNKDRWFFLVTPSYDPEAEEEKLSMQITQLSHDHDEAWINWDVARGNGWLPDGSGYYFISERDGFRNLYRQKPDGEPELLFGGRRVVHSVDLHRTLGGFVVTASFEDDLHRVQSFFVTYDGTARQITDTLGRNRAHVSPDGEQIAAIASATATPDEVYLKEFGSDGPGDRLTDSPSPAFKSYDWQIPAVEYVPAADGTSLPAQVYTPAAGQSNGAGIVFVHGAGYRQNVHKWWRGTSYGRTYCFNVLLAEAGYTVIDIDFRASEGYGRDWRTAIYRAMGGKDLSDQVDGARYLADTYGVDPERIGIYGGSYGGFITLMAMFTEADVFAAGAAMRPVTDWAHYNHPYTSNILNSPQDDAEAYLFSSPIYHAEGLEGALLMTHGIVDDNVHIQGVFRLAQRLIELRKENWEIAVYPVERHGFQEPSSWYDQYRRIWKLFDEHLLGE